MEHEEPFTKGTPPDETDKQHEEAQNTSTMESLLGEEDLTLDLPRQGEIREGVIVSITDDEILVGVGTKSEGVIAKRELEQINPEERENLAVGNSIPVYVLTPEDQHGNLLLSYNRALEESDWKRAEELLESGDVYEGEIQGYNKGGLIVPLGYLRGFVPGSQISLSRRMAYSGNTPDQRWGKMVGEPIAARVIEVDRDRRRLILSERAALQEARELLKERLLEELEEGEVRTGRVTSLADFGAFVNINGADGLVHLTEISWERINHPSEVLKVGQEVRVKVIDIDQERKRIGLSIRQLQEDPWPEKIAGLQVGQLIEGTIVRLVKFGAFARIENVDIEGLIHISEISDQRIEHPKEVLREDEVVTLRIINIDPERHRIGLSLRKVDSPAYADLDWKLAMAEAEQQVEEIAEAPEEMADAAAEMQVAEDEALADTAAEMQVTEDEALADAAAEMQVTEDEALADEETPVAMDDLGEDEVSDMEEASTTAEDSADPETADATQFEQESDEEGAEVLEPPTDQESGGLPAEETDEALEDTDFPDSGPDDPMDLAEADTETVEGPDVATEEEEQ